jgi:hypothetical protein
VAFRPSVAVTSRRRRYPREPDGLVLVARRGIGQIRRVPHAAGHRGHRARQLGAPVGLPPEGRDESCRTAYGAPPGPDPGRLRRATPAFVFPAIGRVPLSRFTYWPPGLARRRCALEAVEKLVTAEIRPHVRPQVWGGPMCASISSSSVRCSTFVISSVRTGYAAL